MSYFTVQKEPTRWLQDNAYPSEQWEEINKGWFSSGSLQELLEMERSIITVGTLLNLDSD